MAYYIKTDQGAEQKRNNIYPKLIPMFLFCVQYKNQNSFGLKRKNTFSCWMNSVSTPHKPPSFNEIKNIICL